MSQWRSFLFSFLAFTPLWLSALVVCGDSIVRRLQPIGTEITLSICIVVMLIISGVETWRAFNNVSPIDELGERILLRFEKQRTITSDFILACVLPLYTFDFTRWCSVLQFMFVMGSILILYAKYYGFPPNVVLEVCKYSCFKCEFTDGKERYVLARSLPTPDKTGSKIRLQALSDSVFIYRASKSN